MKIGYSFWGLCGAFEDLRTIDIDTPDGLQHSRHVLVDELHRQGHQVFALQQLRGSAYPGVTYVGDEFPELDVCFLEWRWSTWKNDKNRKDHDQRRYEPDYDRQKGIIGHYRSKCPILSWDDDQTMTPEDERQYPELIITDPALRPRVQVSPRITMTFWTDWKQLRSVREPEPVYGYIGNNYQRDEQFREYYFRPSAILRNRGIQTKMYGNWLQKSPERRDPKELVIQNREVGFEHRMNFHDSMVRMNSFLCTTHVTKKIYFEVGHITPRYLEAVSVGCPALMPRETANSVGAILGERFVVGNEDEVIEKVKWFDSLCTDERKAVVEIQKQNLINLGLFDVGRAVEIITKC